MNRNPQLIVSAAGVILAMMLGACRDPQVANYSAPKDPPLQLPSNLTDDSAPLSHIHWQMPETWHASIPANTAAASVRAGSFSIMAGDGRSADMSITTFPGDVGGDLANINRWRGQLKLEPITVSELSSVVTTLNVPAGEFLFTDISGDTARTLGAWFKQPGQNRTWFFKLTGETALVGEQRETFLAFLKTITFD